MKVLNRHTIRSDSDVKWERLSSYWWKKISFVNSKLKITYHYKNKIGKSCPTLVIETKLCNQLSGYGLIDKDLRDIKEFINEYEKIKTKSKKFVLVKALTRAIVITYAKCFTKADGRKITLDYKKVFKGNKEYKKLHKTGHYVATG